MSDQPLALDALPSAANPRTPDHILAIAGRRRRRRLAGATVAASAVAALLVALPDGATTRTRGLGGAPLVGISAVAEGPRGLRPLASGDALRPGEQVVFRLAASADGDLTFTEAGGAPIWPPAGAWSVRVGTHFLGDPPLAWTPDHPGPTTLVARLCPLGGTCGTAEFVVNDAP